MALGTKARKPKTRLTEAVTRLFPKQGEWTEEAYFALPETNQFIELSQGELIMPPPPSDFHQSVNGKLYIELDRFVNQHKSGVVRISPLPVRLWEGRIREPDVVFLLNEHMDRRGAQFWGPPDLVMEVISPSTRITDRRDKYQEYAQAGVGEYWLIHPHAKTVEVYSLDGSVYAAVGTFRSGESAMSKLLDGFTVNVKGLFAD